MASSCCWATVQDPGWTGEGLCTECREHCTDESEEDEKDMYLSDWFDRDRDDKASKD
jgi:hypothetical protein